MTTLNSDVKYIKNELRKVYQSLETKHKEIAADILVNAVSNLNKQDFKAAFVNARQLYMIAGKPISGLEALFHAIQFAEDVVTDDSVVFIHEDSPYKESLEQLSKDLGFTVQSHNFCASKWTKDYVVSTGREVMVPVKNAAIVDTYMTKKDISRAQKTSSLYYGALGITEHHQSKNNFISAKMWHKHSTHVINRSKIIYKTALEGGNLFCAINEKGVRYNLLGENVVSDTMAYNKVDCPEAIKIISDELACPPDQLLIIPQWTYHLDLQMAYLGKGQFVIHSFDQPTIDFDLSKEEIAKIDKTFKYLKGLFEASIIDETCSLLEKHGFKVDKVFGCLFYLDDCDDLEQKKWVPHCKSGENFEGAIASMMNGISLNLGDKGRYFLTSKCDSESFKEQYANSLKKLGISEVYDVDMLEYYDYSGEFEAMLSGIMGACGVSHVAAAMDGALRCQTSIVSKSLTTQFNPRGSRFYLFKSVDNLDLADSEEPDVRITIK